VPGAPPPALVVNVLVVEVFKVRLDADAPLLVLSLEPAALER
jgi:hypothetical protein